MTARPYTGSSPAWWRMWILTKPRKNSRSMSSFVVTLWTDASNPERLFGVACLLRGDYDDVLGSSVCRSLMLTNRYAAICPE
jgi:hypothetical protein